MFIPRLTTLTLAAAIALAGLGAPARAADPQDVARLVGAATTLFLLGKIIQDRQDDRRDKASHRAPERSPAFRDRARYEPHWSGDRHRGYRQAPQRHAGRALPRACRIETRHGPARYEGRCLYRYGYRP